MKYLIKDRLQGTLLLDRDHGMFKDQRGFWYIFGHWQNGNEIVRATLKADEDVTLTPVEG